MFKKSLLVFIVTLINSIYSSNESSIRLYRVRRSNPALEMLIQSGANSAAKITDVATDALIDHLKNGQRAIILRNEMKRGILLHCKDKNTDYGRLWVMPNESYFFTFWANFWGASLYWCSLRTRLYEVGFHAYGGDAPYDNNRFAIRKTGVYVKAGGDYKIIKGVDSVFPEEVRKEFDKDWLQYKKAMIEQQKYRQQFQEEENIERRKDGGTETNQKPTAPTVLNGSLSNQGNEPISSKRALNDYRRRNSKKLSESINKRVSAKNVSKSEKPKPPVIPKKPAIVNPEIIRKPSGYQLKPKLVNKKKKESMTPLRNNIIRNNPILSNHSITNINRNRNIVIGNNQRRISRPA